jgi:class 3 adenylate cyclase/predicted ATPase
LEQLGLGQYASVFDEQQIDHEVLPELTDADLEKLGIPLGPRKKLLKAIGDLQPALATPHPETIPHTATPDTSHAERRQLTVMFCDLVGSTDLSQKLDPEDMREVNRVYQDACKAAIERYDGYVARYMGDGVLAYFGYPQAHEDDAERAVHAGLGLVQVFSRLNADVSSKQGVELRVRIGIETGLVVVGDLIGEGASQESAVVGETPNLAARLQGLAAPNTVVIGPGAYELAAGRFEYQDLGSKKVKGISEPVRAWRVMALAVAESRFEASHKGRLAPLIGREHEIGLLLDRWQQAKEGDGQVVLLSGESGIGKSHIAQTLRDRTIPDRPIRLRYQCSPHHTNSALHPTIEQLERAAQFSEKDSPTAKLDKLEALLAQATQSVESVAPLFAALMSIPAGGRYTPLEMPPDRQKEKTLEALAGQLNGLSHNRPVLLIFEDLHWADPTSLELLELIIEQSQGAAVLVLITFRPEFTPPWKGRTHVTSLTLNRFSRSLVTAMVKKVTGGKLLPDEVRDEIVERTDGVPLFVEELTKSILESGLVKEEPHRYVLTGPLAAVAIPATLHDSLMARLDRLGPVKEVAQCASVIGREFEYDLLTSVSTLSTVELHDALHQLVDAELVFRRGRSLQASYIFKHALVQDAAYESLLRSKRQRLHARVVAGLEDRFPERVEAEPELLAYHLTEADLTERAMAYWQKAGERAIERSAHMEAMTHLAKALELLATMPDTPERTDRELALQVHLGVVTSVTSGPGSRETERIYTRARELCRDAGDAKSLFPVLWGLWRGHMARGELSKAKHLADQLLDVAVSAQDSSQLVEAHHSEWTTLFYSGELTSVREHTDRGIAIYTPEQHGSLGFTYGGHDPGVCGLLFNAWGLWLLGYPDEALVRNREALDLAHELAGPSFLAHGAIWTMLLLQLRRDAASLREHSGKYMTAIEAESSPYDRGAAYILQGWSLAHEGARDKGTHLMSEGLALQPETEIRLRPYFLSLLAESHAKTGDLAEAKSLLGQAIEVMEHSEDRWWEAELHRLKGELLLLESKQHGAESEGYFRKAIDVAQIQNAKSLELRAATNLARLHQSHGEMKEAYDLLAPVFDWFTEGFSTPDLENAKALLEALS